MRVPMTTGLADWCQAVNPEGNKPIAVGSTARVARRVGPRVFSTTERLTDLSPPRRWVVRGEGGLPVIAIASGAIEPGTTVSTRVRP